MEKIFENLDTEKVTNKMHQEIMTSVKVAKKRYYFIGLLCGILFATFIFGYLFINEMSHGEILEFISEYFDAIKIDSSLAGEFFQEWLEFMPWKNFIIFSIIFLMAVFILKKAVKFKKAIFSKVEKFNKN